MAVNLEELALKSIEQYAAFGVRLASLETTLLDYNRKNESREDKISQVLNTVTRLDERLTTSINESAKLERRVNTLTTDLATLTNNVNNLLNGFGACSADFRDHEENHCESCANIGRIAGIETNTQKLTEAVDALSAKVEKMLSPEIVEVRQLITSKYGMQWLRFMMSRYGFYWMIAVSVAVLLVFWSHHDIIKALWGWVKMGG